MISGASNSDLMIILIDARQGVIEQTRRHSIIASLLKIKHVVVTVNKMDLVNYSQEIFENIKTDYLEIAKKLNLNNIQFFPISALDGDNIVDQSTKMPWYKERSLLEYLEQVEINKKINFEETRFQVQFVIRPQTEEFHDYRGYAGEIVSGIYKKGDRIKVLPQNIETTISKVETGGKEVDEVFPPQPAVIHIKDDIDISRGDYFVQVDQIPRVENEFQALVCWMDQKELVAGNKYFLQHRSKLIKAIVKEIDYKIDVNSLKETLTDSVKLNEIVRVTIKTASPLVFDSFDKNKGTGSAILIDETSNSTVGGVMIL